MEIIVLVVTYTTAVVILGYGFGNLLGYREGTEFSTSLWEGSYESIVELSVKELQKRTQKIENLETQISEMVEYVYREQGMYSTKDLFQKNFPGEWRKAENASRDFRRETQAVVAKTPRESNKTKPRKSCPGTKGAIGGSNDAKATS